MCVCCSKYQSSLSSDLCPQTRPTKTINIPYRPGEPYRSKANISKIKKKIGWKPSISFEKGFAELLLNIKYWKNAPLWNKSSINKVTKNWFKYLK